MIKNTSGVFFAKGDIVIRLPINPETLPIERPTDNGTYNVLGLGDIVVPRLPSLRTVEIESYFPKEYDENLNVLTPTRFKEPQFYVDFFETALREKEVLTFVQSSDFDENNIFDKATSSFFVVVESFTTEERGGELGDVYYTLSLTEYRDYSPLRIVIDENGNAIAAREREIARSELYIGAEVTANGAGYYSSWGDTPSKQRQITGTINLIADRNRPYPYHVVDENNAPMGWFSSAALKRVV